MRRARCVAIVAWAFVVALIVALPAGARAQGMTEPAQKARRLLAAYPAFLARIEGNNLVWKDGRRMVIDDGIKGKDPQMRLARPDLKDMFVDSYLPGAGGIPPPAGADPGRVRHFELFDRMYGDCRKDEVERNLVPIVWLPKKWGKRVRITKINGAAARLEAVSHALDELPERFDPYLFPHDGTYNCRPIAGTDRISAHGHGIAIDLAAKHSDYWRWTAKKQADAGASIPYRNSFPMEIVRIFEQHGFIWGGKWYHYDTMHFEYRPELLER